MTGDDSTMNSPTSIAVESLGSDEESVISIGSGQTGNELRIPEDTVSNKLFSLGDGDFNLNVNGVTFHTHKYLLKRFSVLKRLVEKTAANQECEELSLEHGAVDFLNTCKVLYASPIEGLSDFDPATLVSALRLATIYDYPALRTFAIKKLENTQLSAIERIRIAREFKLVTWEAPAYEELCARDEPISEGEANVLGISALVQVAKIREKEQRRKCCEAKSNYQQTAPNVSQVLKPILFAEDRRKIAQKAGKARVDPAKDDELVREFKPSFIGISSPKRSDEFTNHVSNSGALEYKVPNCRCFAPKGVNIGKGEQDGFGGLYGVHVSGGHRLSKNTECRCTVSPCVADALAQLQTAQITHSTSIKKLNSTVQDIAFSLAPPEPCPVVDESEPGPSVPKSNQLTLVQAEVQKWLVVLHKTQAE